MINLREDHKNQAFKINFDSIYIILILIYGLISNHQTIIS